MVWEPIDRTSLTIKSKIEARGTPELTIGPKETTGLLSCHTKRLLTV